MVPGLLLFDALNQLIRNIGVFNPHNAFLGTAETQKVDAPIPYNFLIHDCEFLMDIRFKNNTYTIAF